MSNSILLPNNANTLLNRAEYITYFHNYVYVLLGISPALICSLPTFRNPVSVPSSKAGSRLSTSSLPPTQSLLPAFEDGTDTGFRNVGKLYIEAGDIPKRTYTLFKPR
jgi:hypothetical protein